MAQKAAGSPKGPAVAPLRAVRGKRAAVLFAMALRCVGSDSRFRWVRDRGWEVRSLSCCLARGAVIQGSPGAARTGRPGFDAQLAFSLYLHRVFNLTPCISRSALPSTVSHSLPYPIHCVFPTSRFPKDLFLSAGVLAQRRRTEANIDTRAKHTDRHQSEAARKGARSSIRARTPEEKTPGQLTALMPTGGSRRVGGQRAANEQPR